MWEEASSDPREPFARSLCEAVAGVNTIIVYNKSFESSRLAELAEWLPKYRTALIEARDKLWDLLPVVRGNVYHPAFCGSYGLKSVLPALVPGMPYDKLTIQDGAQAGVAWMQLLSATDARERLSSAGAVGVLRARHAWPRLHLERPKAACGIKRDGLNFVQARAEQPRRDTR